MTENEKPTTQSDNDGYVAPPPRTDGSDHFERGFPPPERPQREKPLRK